MTFVTSKEGGTHLLFSIDKDSFVLSGLFFKVGERMSLVKL